MLSNCRSIDKSKKKKDQRERRRRKRNARENLLVVVRGLRLREKGFGVSMELRMGLRKRM